MISFIRLCFLLIVASVIPLTTVSAGQAPVKLLNAATFNKATAVTNQRNSFTTPPPCNCDNTNTAATSTAAPSYYAPPTPPASPTEPPVSQTVPPASQTDTNATQSNNSGILFGSGASSSPGLLIH